MISSPVANIIAPLNLLSWALKRHNALSNTVLPDLARMTLYFPLKTFIHFLGPPPLKENKQTKTKPNQTIQENPTTVRPVTIIAH